jgi:ABC-type phosphonate transport system ATPase subunit
MSGSSSEAAVVPLLEVRDLSKSFGAKTVIYSEVAFSLLRPPGGRMCGGCQ